MARAQSFYASLGRRIQDRRKARHFTQEQLGALLTPPVTRASIANIEAGKQGVLTHSLVQLARALDVTVEQLLPEEAASIGQPELRGRVQTELQEKLSVPLEASERLMKKLMAGPPSPGRRHERSAGKSRG